MKKKLILLICALVVVALISALVCYIIKRKEKLDNSDKLNIVTTIFPEYDWVNNIVGDDIDNVDITMLLDNGVDLHSYQPTADDIIKISECDVFIYVGGESDAWVEDALKEAVNKDMKVINLLDVLKNDIKEEELKEGMQEEEHEHSEEEHEHDDEEGHEHGDDEIEYDEHIWLSVKNAVKICNTIADTLEDIDEANKDKYAANAKSYIEKLTKLDNDFSKALASATNNTLVFGDRFPFLYMFNDYKLDYYAAFPGCSAETEASFETIAFLANKLEELKLSSIMTIEGSQHKIAETIVNATSNKNQKLLELDSMQSVTSKDVSNGTTYLAIMEDNMKVIEEGLKQND